MFDYHEQHLEGHNLQLLTLIRLVSQDVDQTCKTTKFLKLTIVNTADSTDNEAYVTFRATFQQGKWSEKARMLNERSRFLKEDGRWLYRAAFPLNENTL